MKSTDKSATVEGTAEDDFRSAFYRLKVGRPSVLPSGAKVSQNNVAKEAGRDPSALKKSRYPNLVSEIQEWVSSTYSNPASNSQGVKKVSRFREERLKSIIAILKRDRDIAQSLLIEAHAKILELNKELSLYKKDDKPRTNITFL